VSKKAIRGTPTTVDKNDKKHGRRASLTTGVFAPSSSGAEKEDVREKKDWDLK